MIVVVLTAYFKAGSWSGLGDFPWQIVMVGAGILFFRMVCLMSLSGTLRSLTASVFTAANALYNFFYRSVTDQPAPEWRFVQVMGAKSGGPLRRTDKSWYFLLVLGILAMVIIVAGSGGVADSPFRDILVATFILGQFRAPTSKGIWALFGFGLLSVGAAHILFLVLENIDPLPFDSIHFRVEFYIAPGLLVGFISTMVYWLTFKAQAAVSDSVPTQEVPNLDDGLAGVDEI